MVKWAGPRFRQVRMRRAPPLLTSYSTRHWTSISTRHLTSISTRHLTSILNRHLTSILNRHLTSNSTRQLARHSTRNLTNIILISILTHDLSFKPSFDHYLARPSICHVTRASSVISATSFDQMVK